VSGFSRTPITGRWDNSRRPFLFVTLTDLLVARIRARGPLTVAEFMDAALYDPERGYYASAAQRSGRAGDFFTSVDVGPLFGELLAVQLDEMWRLTRAAGGTTFDLVEAGAGNGRLTRDILDAAAVHHREMYEHMRVTLVERSAAAREAHAATLGDAHRDRPIASLAELPAPIDGVILANELLDALPVHVVIGTDAGLREVYVAERAGALVETTGDLSDPAIAAYLDRLGVAPAVGARADVGLQAIRWIEEAARSLARGFLLLIDYGHEAAELFSPSHASGTLTGYRAHRLRPDWLSEPGGRDLTAHVNLTAIRLAAEDAGLTTIGMVDQTYFLMSLGITDRVAAGPDRAAVARRLAAKTLVMPGGLGSTMKTMAFARGLPGVRLAGLSSGRLT
jgi:SAM-dependent MidA family methyltransferase